MGRIEGDQIQKRVIQQPQPKVEPKVESKIKVDQRVNTDSSTTRRADLQNYGQQQRDRIEGLYGAGAAVL